MKKNDIRYALLDQFHIVLLAEIGVSVLLYRVFFVERCSSVQGSLEQQSIRSHQRNGCIHPSAIGLRRSDFTVSLMAILDYTGSHCAC